MFVGCYCLLDLMSVGYCGFCYLFGFVVRCWVGLVARCLVWVWVVLVCVLVALSVAWLVAGVLFGLFACIVYWLHMGVF